MPRADIQPPRHTNTGPPILGPPTDEQFVESDSGMVSGEEEVTEIEHWDEKELAILNHYLPRYKLKNKTERKLLLVRKVLKQMKDLYKGPDWTRRKTVNHSCSSATSLTDHF
jgi:hypothetical protein